MKIPKNPAYLVPGLLLLALLTLWRGTPAAQEEPEFFKRETPVEVTADYLSYDKETDTYYAKGNVVIVQEGTVLEAEEATLNMTTGQGRAEGDVFFTDEEGNTLEGTDLRFNVKEKTAVLLMGRLFYKKENVHITGDVIRKTAPESYDIEKGTYTTCDCPEGGSPAWDFSISEGKVTVGDFLTGKHAFFHIKDVPVLYSPYIRVPVKRERQTGFLRPRPGYSELRGFKLDNAFFWAIAKNADATFYLEIETSRGVGAATEFRYIRTRKSSGEFFFRYFNENDITRVREFREDVENLARPETAGRDRWELRFDHTEVFGPGLSLRADVNLVSDDEYFIDFGEGERRSTESLETNISVSKNWANWSFVTQARIFDNLLLGDDSETIKKLPEVTLNGSDQRIPFTPLYISSSSSLINFSRDEGVVGQRADLHPKVSLPLSPDGYFDFTAFFAPRATFYWVENHPEGRYVDRFIYDTGADITTTFVKTFHTGFDTLKGIQHTVRPRLSYTYIPEAVQTDLPSFDAVDSIPATNAVTYSLNSVITGKFVGAEETKKYIRFLYLDISQSFDINEATRDIAPGTERRPFSEISAELILSPTERSTFTARGKYDLYEPWFTSFDTQFSYSTKRGDSLNLSYRFLRDEFRYLEAAVRVHARKDIDLSYFKRFSLDEDRSLETSYAIEYTHQCWKTVLSYTEKLEEKIVLLTFYLKGIGRAAGVKGELE